jgi:hypothetical protein
MLAVAEGAISPLARWESFYVIVGSSAAALTGLQFVVITLMSEGNRPTGPATIRAFGTPTIVHFCAVLLISSIVSAPWSVVANAGAALAACGFLGLAYAVLVVRTAARQTFYKPVLEDWIWHGVLPVIAYASLLVASLVVRHDPVPALFGIGGSALLLLFIGIHNAWDAVTYVAIDRPESAKASKDQR